MAIQVLDQDTINKIAAGEVIERPSSVVKELVENAIDAGATAITIEIKDGGISMIRVTDNGIGMAGDEIAKAFLRHSTSKIKSIEDLVHISSLGFRGEALSSIAAVSRVELITKTADSLTGWRYAIEGGAEAGMEEVGAPDGTTFIVRNLFFNTPVRRKFLKTAQTEAGYISSLIEHLALSRPDISFRFINNNQNRLHTSGNTNLKDIIYSVYGRDITSNLIAISAKTQDITITGFIGKPMICRGNRTYENYYINGRYIKSSIITKALEDAYKGYIMPHNYPFTAVHFQINAAIMDVNVHPTKMELRFSQNDAVYSFVFDAVKTALKSGELSPEISLADISRKQPVTEAGQALQSKIPMKLSAADTAPSTKSPKPAPAARLPEPFEKNRFRELLAAEEVKEYAAKEGAAKENTVKEGAAKENTASAETMQQLSVFSDALLANQKNADYRIIGQLFETYWLIEYADKFYMMDQHAAHEKILFEKMMARLREKPMDTQMLMPPMILELTMRQAQVLHANMEAFVRVGFALEDFGGNAYKVTGVPAGLPAIDDKQLLIDMLDSFSETARCDLDLLTEKVASMSCKAAVKGNNKMSFAEASELISELMRAENPYNCPHGRPTLIVMSKYEIEKRFKRIL